MTVTRFAPSPTGRLHVGNLRTAIVNWMFARKSGGEFLLRLDDTDQERSRDEYVQEIRSDLAWLGMAPDGEERQSDRLSLYEAAFDKLRESGRIYPAYETPEELEVRRKIQLSRGLPPVYDRAALKLTAAERTKLEAEGRVPHWRFRLHEEAEIRWHDRIRGEAHIDPASLSDPVVRRADGSFLYMLPSVVDDIDMAITHVVRGEDHVTNSGVQIQMFGALGAEPPAFAHMSLLVGAEGGKLSKRAGDLSTGDLRSAGIEPIALMALLARIGTSQPVEPVTTAVPLIETFDFAAFGRAPARFDPDELAGLNAKILHQLDYDDVAPRLPQGMDARAWNVIRPNLQTLQQADDWWQVVKNDPPAQVDVADAAFLREAESALAELEDGEDLWKRWTSEVKERTGRKGRALFMPLRLALTGRDHGPDMAGMLSLMGRSAALRRLANAAGLPP